MTKRISILIFLVLNGCGEKVIVNDTSSAKVQPKVVAKNVIEKPLVWVLKFQKVNAKELKRMSFDKYQHRGKKKHYKRGKKKVLFSPPKETKIKF